MLVLIKLLKSAGCPCTAAFVGWLLAALNCCPVADAPAAFDPGCPTVPARICAIRESYAGFAKPEVAPITFGSCCPTRAFKFCCACAFGGGVVGTVGAPGVPGPLTALAIVEPMVVPAPAIAEAAPIAGAFVARNVPTVARIAATSVSYVFTKTSLGL